MSDRYWVVGGQFTDTGFSRLVPGTGQRLGPFDSYAEAKATWQAKAMETIDDAHVRFTIEREAAEAEAAPEYWVVGGEYTDTSFTRVVGEEERIGPFATYEAAKTAWQAKARETIDDAHVRYRVEQA